MIHGWSGQDVAAVIGAVGLLVTAIAAATSKILAAIHSIHRDVNSRMDELVAETRKAALAEGRQVEREASAGDRQTERAAAASDLRQVTLEQGRQQEREKQDP